MDIAGQAASEGFAIGTNIINSGINRIFGIDKYNDERQIKQQQKLTDIQSKANEDLMNKSYEKQQEMYNNSYQKNTPAAMKSNYEIAGLNPALMYGGATSIGGISTGGGGASVSGGNAADAASTAQLSNQQTQIALQSAMIQSQIETNKANANNANADAELKRSQIPNSGKTGANIEANTANINANTQTINELRNYIVENARQQGIGQWMDNIRKDYEQQGTGGDVQANNETYKAATVIRENGNWNENILMEIAQKDANAGNAVAQAALTNTKTKYYYQEINAMIVNAMANQKNAETNAGELAVKQELMKNTEFLSKIEQLKAAYQTGYKVDETGNYNMEITPIAAAEQGINAIKTFGGLINTLKKPIGKK